MIKRIRKWKTKKMEVRKQKQKNEGKAALVGKEFYRNICWVKTTLVEEQR